MVSTVAAGDTKPYVGTGVVVMFPSVVDVAISAISNDRHAVVFRAEELLEALVEDLPEPRLIIRDDTALPRGLSLWPRRFRGIRSRCFLSSRRTGCACTLRIASRFRGRLSRALSRCCLIVLHLCHVILLPFPNAPDDAHLRRRS
jgi:hypothetical protein